MLLGFSCLKLAYDFFNFLNRCSTIAIAIPELPFIPGTQFLVGGRIIDIKGPLANLNGQAAIVGFGAHFIQGSGRG